MAKVVGPLFSLKASGSFGDIVFDKRGFARPKGNTYDPQTANQGNFRQTMVAAQKCASVCGDNTRQLLRGMADNSARWSAFLVKNLIGPERAAFQEALETYNNGADVDQNGWEMAATNVGLRPVNIAYASDSAISPGAQLFMLASTLYDLGIYTAVGQPNGNAADWQQNITS